MGWASVRKGRPALCGSFGRSIQWMSGFVGQRAGGRLAFTLTTLGVAGALALLPLAFLAPVYSGESVSSGGVTAATSDTLVGINGLSVLVPLSVPLVLALAVWVGLHLRCSRGSVFGTALGWSCAAVLAVFSLVALFSIGVLVLPAALLLVVGAAVTPDGRATSGRTVT